MDEAGSTENPDSMPSSSAVAENEPAVQRAGRKINTWFSKLKKAGSFTVQKPEILAAARAIFTTHHVSDAETSATIQACYRGEIIERKGYVLDTHAAAGVAAALRQIQQQPSSNAEDVTKTDDQSQNQKKMKMHTIMLATAHPAKFAKAVDVAVKVEASFDFAWVLSREFVGLDETEMRVRKIDPVRGWR